MNAKPEGFGDEVYGEGKRFFDEAAIDNLYEAFMELTAEVWVHRDRTIIMEAVLDEMLAKDGVSLTERIEQFRPSPELDARRKSEREAYATSVYRSFTRHLTADGDKGEQQ